MTVFNWIALSVAAVLYLRLPRKKGLNDFAGSVIAGFAWPVFIVMVPYFWVKRRIFRRDSSPSVMQLEIIGCLVVGLGGLIGYLWWS